MNTNMDLLSKVLIFAAGVAVGSTVMYKMIKDKYEQLAQEEIDSVKNEFGIGVKKDKPEETVEPKKEEKNKNTSSLNEYDKIIRSQNYTRYSAGGDDEKEEEVRVDKPYVISPEEFDELDDYETNELTYYACGTLADDCDNIIDDVDEIVGDDFAEHFGEYEDDSVYIRNDTLKCDYAIMRDYRRYSEVCREDY